MWSFRCGHLDVVIRDLSGPSARSSSSRPSARLPTRSERPLTSLASEAFREARSPRRAAAPAAARRDAVARGPNTRAVAEGDRSEKAYKGRYGTEKAAA